MRSKMEIGVQLYTFRDFCKDREGLSLTLKKVADIGYKTVQLSGVCSVSADWMKDRLSENGLRCVLTHTASDRLREELSSVIAEHSTLKCDYIGLGVYLFETESDIESFKKTYLPISKEIKSHGKYFMHHNHAREFRKFGGKTVMERLMCDFSPDLMGITLDTYWVQVAGADSAEWLEYLSGRVPCVHLKDCAFDGKMASLGNGNINFNRVLGAAEAAKTEFLLVEQDECYGEDPFECVRRSYEYLHSMGF